MGISRRPFAAFIRFTRSALSPRLVTVDVLEKKWANAETGIAMSQKLNKKIEISISMLTVYYLYHDLTKTNKNI